MLWYHNFDFDIDTILAKYRDIDAISIF